jgi:predicted nuclease of restriction endonuclease-like (RecB) superfamily
MIDDDEYKQRISEISALINQARRKASYAVNSVMLDTYWKIGHWIEEEIQRSKGSTEYWEYQHHLIKQIGPDLNAKFGRAFSEHKLQLMHIFYNEFENPISQSQIAEWDYPSSLSWSHYSLLIASPPSPETRAFYQKEALRGRWTTQHLDILMNSQFYERVTSSTNKFLLLEQQASMSNSMPEDTIKDPFVLEFLDLKDEYEESDTKKALIEHFAQFLLELDSNFALLGRQKRVHFSREWYCIDLLFFHRKLRCLVVIDLQVGEEFMHGKIYAHTQYAQVYWTNDDENPPVGLILFTNEDENLARYALEGLPNKVLAAEYKLQLPDEALLTQELERVRQQLQKRQSRIADEN